MAIGDLRLGGWADVQLSTYRYAVYRLPEQTLLRMMLRGYVASEVAWDEA